MGLAGHQAGDGAGGLDIVDGGEAQRIGHIGAKGQAHAAALEIGADQQRQSIERRQLLHQRDLGGQVAAMDAGNAAGLEAAHVVRDLSRGAARQQHEELGQLVARRQRIVAGVDPGQGLVIEIEWRSSQIR